jgi:hypothetical protein
VVLVVPVPESLAFLKLPCVWLQSSLTSLQNASRNLPRSSEPVKVPVATNRTIRGPKRGQNTTPKMAPQTGASFGDPNQNMCRNRFLGPKWAPKKASKMDPGIKRQFKSGCEKGPRKGSESESQDQLNKLTMRDQEWVSKKAPKWNPKPKATAWSSFQKCNTLGVGCFCAR